MIPLIHSLRLLLIATVFGLASSAHLHADETDQLSPIGTMGKGERVIGGAAEAVLFEHEGKGCLTHFWFGGNFKGVEDTRIRYYVDGEEQPSIDMDLYMGHGIGFNDNQSPWATKYIGKVGKRNGIYNNYRIPFSKSIRVTAQQRQDDPAPNPQIWWIIRGIENGRVRLGGVLSCRKMPGSSFTEGKTMRPSPSRNLISAKWGGRGLSSKWRLRPRAAA
jgi:hypothetical protein